MPAPLRFRLPTFTRRVRPLSLLAACLLVLGPGVAAVAPAASAASANLLSNGDFATGSTSGWTCSAGDTVVSSPTFDGSSFALAGTPAGSDYARCSQVVSVQPSSSYSLSGWVEGDYVFLGDSGTGGTDTDDWTPSAATWTELSTSFTTGSSTTSVTTYANGWYGQPGFYADALTLTGAAGSGGGGSGGGTTAPAAPANLAVTGTTSSSVSLSWAAPSGTVTGYYVSEDGTQVATVTGTTDTVTGLAASTAYTFTVAAYNSAGTSPQSSSVSGTTSAAGSGPPTGGSLGSNVIVFTPSESQSSIQSELNTIASDQVGNQFGTARYALLFAPGTYGSTADPLTFQVGFYTSVAGLGQNPSQTVINGTIDVYNQCSGTTCNATDNFWRSVSNLTINVTGQTGCEAGDDFWAVSQAAPMRRVQVNGNLSLMDYCNGSPDYASGGFIADSDFTGGTVTNGSQQQYFVQNSSLDGWSNAVWNQVFSGDTGAVPAQSFASNSGDSGGPSSYTTLANSPVTEEEPYLYTDSSGNYNVFVPSLQTNSSGPTWTTSSNTPGTSLSVNNTFYIVNSA